MRISILSAVHNEASYGEEMIQSVVRQTHTDWELLFVDDGSTDGTDQILKRATQADRRIREAGDGSKIGKVAAFNLAFDDSAGEVIVLLAGDDTLPPDSLATRVAALGHCGSEKSVGSFKLRSFSVISKYDSMGLPRDPVTGWVWGQAA